MVEGFHNLRRYLLLGPWIPDWHEEWWERCINTNTEIHERHDGEGLMRSIRDSRSRMATPVYVLMTEHGV